MNVKKYKLVPIEFFNDVNKTSESDIKNKNDDNDNNNYNNNNNKKNERSIKDIISSNLEETNFKPSKHYVADFKIGDVPSQGGGVSDKNSSVPVFLPNASVLPENSESYKLRTLDTALNELLADKSLSEDLKIKLYLIFKEKYDATRRNIEELQDVNMIADENPKGILNKVVSELPKSKLKDGYKLANILADASKKYIKWNADGVIIHPVVENSGTFDLRMLIKTILYKKSVPNVHTTIAEKIVRPFFGQLMKEELISNDKLKKLNRPVRLSNYVPW